MRRSFIAGKSNLSTPIAFSPLRSLILTCLIGGAYALAGDIVVRRFGRRRLLAFWLATSIGLGVIGTLRNLQNLRIGPARVNVPGLYILLITTTLVVLAVPTVALARGPSLTDTPAAVARRFLAGIGWIFGGLLVVLVGALVLDLSNIPFIPIH